MERKSRNNSARPLLICSGIPNIVLVSPLLSIYSKTTSMWHKLLPEEPHSFAERRVLWFAQVWITLPKFFRQGTRQFYEAGIAPVGHAPVRHATPGHAAGSARSA